MVLLRFNERSFVVLVAAGLVAAAAAAIVLWPGSDEPGAGRREGPTENAAASLAGGPDEVLMLSGTSLVRRNVEAETEEIVGRIPTPSVYAAPGSSWLAYVTSKQAADEDFATEPVLHLYDAETGDKSGYGPGVAPSWNAAGTHVAFLRPVEPRNCVLEECPGDVQIGVVEAATGRESLLLEPGQYSVLGWAGERVLVGDFNDPSGIISVSLEDEAERLDFPVSQFWGASPDGRWLVKTNAKKTEFVEFVEGVLGAERVPVELADYELMEGAWAHDSSSVAAVVRLSEGVQGGGVQGGKDKKAADLEEATTLVVTFSPTEPRPTTVEGTSGATGRVLWSTTNEAVVFSRLVDPKKALFQAQHCRVRNESDCRIVVSWTEGVALLRTE